MSDNPFRQLPKVDDVLATAALQALAGEHAHERIVEAVRHELDALRKRLQQGADLDAQGEPAAVAQRAAQRLRQEMRPRLRPVINATGIVLHTNLGRAPMAEPAARAAYEAARGYLNLEMDLDTGTRGSRQDAIRDWVSRLTGAESATAVNNNAAATIITLRVVAPGKEVVISRGQLIEIGGSFRIPEIMAVSGAVLREVGTTNITRLADYERAIGPATGALLRVHPSNYRIAGFTGSVGLAELAALGRKHRLPVIDDIGSGALVDLTGLGLHGEPVARASITAGADLVLFSGDKLLGGPQAGIIAGRKDWVSQVEKDPLMRAFRLDKMTLAALEATLRLYMDPERSLDSVPVLRLLSTPSQELRRRAEGLAQRFAPLPGLASARPAEDVNYAGGGSLPDQALPTWVVEVTATGVGDAELAQRLRTGEPAVVGRVRDGRMVIDVRTVFPHQEDDLVRAIAAALKAPQPAQPTG
jgi:L-seryl-tRNA(Ser) seleniumtransferase